MRRVRVDRLCVSTVWSQATPRFAMISWRSYAASPLGRPAPTSTDTFTSFASLASTLIAAPLATAITRTTSDAPR